MQGVDSQDCESRLVKKLAEQEVEIASPLAQPHNLLMRQFGRASSLPSLDCRSLENSSFTSGHHASMPPGITLKSNAPARELLWCSGALPLTASRR